MFRYARGTMAAQRDNQQIIDVLHNLGKLPMEAFEHLRVESAPKNAILQPSAVRFQNLGDTSQSLRVTDVVADQVPLFEGHESPQPQVGK